MNEATDLPIDPVDRLYDPPLVDHLTRDEEGFSIEFVPPDEVTTAEKCFVRVDGSSPEGRCIAVFLGRIEELIDAGPVRRIIHSGGGDYQIEASGAKVLQSLGDLPNDAAIECMDRIHQIAQSALYAYLIQERLRRSA